MMKISVIFFVLLAVQYCTSRPNNAGKHKSWAEIDHGTDEIKLPGQQDEGNFVDELDSIMDESMAIEKELEDLEKSKKAKRTKEDENEKRNLFNVNMKHGLKNDILTLPISVKRSFTSNSNFKWPKNENGTLQIPYSFAAGNYTDGEKTIIEQAIEDINTNITCHDAPWVPKDSSHEGQVYIEFFKGQGCYSYVGRVAHFIQNSGNRQEISIGNGCVFHSTIQHEMMHAMGFHHEQSRPDRDEYVIINVTNVRAGFESNFDKKNPNDVDPGYNRSTYDYYSVMHYGQYFFAKDRSIPTIIPKSTTINPSILGNVPAVSAEDIREMNILFSCADTALTTTQAPLTTTQAPVETTTEGGSGFGPETTTQEPVKTTQRPATTTQRPVITTQAPVETTTEGGSGFGPETTTQEPVKTTQRPATTTQRPVTTTRRPNTTTRRPETTTRRPETTTRRPVTTTRRPVTTTRRPQIILNSCNFTTKYGCQKQAVYLSRKWSIAGDCIDKSRFCPFMKRIGLCSNTSGFFRAMEQNCPVSCKCCPADANNFGTSSSRYAYIITRTNTKTKAKYPTPCKCSTTTGVCQKRAYCFQFDYALTNVATTSYNGNNAIQTYALTRQKYTSTSSSRRWSRRRRTSYRTQRSTRTYVPSGEVGEEGDWVTMQVNHNLECADSQTFYITTARRQTKEVRVDNVRLTLGQCV